jgi:hypothetical protein
MYRLKDDQLINCYLEAKKLKLDNKFLHLLLIELNKRNLGFNSGNSKGPVSGRSF